MAKSYVTKFVENMAQQRDILEARMKQIGVPVNKDMSINELTSLLSSTSLNLKYSFDYDRDPNFPDIDALFDNDTLRAANGGEHKFCSYSIVRINADKTIYCPYNYYTKLDNGTYQGYYSKIFIGNGSSNDKVVIWDGGTSSPSSSVNIVLTDDEMSTHTFKGEDGFVYTLVRVYYNNDRIANFYGESNSGGKQYVIGQSIEAIADTSITMYGYEARTGSGNPNLQYIRFPLSNATADLIGSSSTNLSRRASKLTRYDGMFRAGQCTGSCENLLLYGKQIGGYTIQTGTTTSTTSYTALANSQCAGTYISPIADPNETFALTFAGYAPKNVIIRTGVKSVGTLKGTYSGQNPFERAKRVLLANTVDSISGLSLYCDELIIEQGAFGGSSTDGLNLGYCYGMKKETLLNVFNNIADRTGLTARTITIPKFLNLALTAEEKEIATNKNWTISVGSN